MVDRNILAKRRCTFSGCKCVVSRVVESGAVWVEAYAGRRSDPVKALHAGKVSVVDSTSRTTWHRLTGPTEVTCSQGHTVTISPAVEIERAGLRLQETSAPLSQAGLANGIAQVLMFAHAHPEVLGNDPNYSPPPLDYSALATATEQVANAAPTGVYGFG